MSKWTLETPVQMIAVSVDARVYKQIVADLAEIFYRHFRQLNSPFPLAPSIETVTATTPAKGSKHE